MKPIENLRPEQQDEVRSQVRALLERTGAFREVPPETRRSIAQGLVDVVAFLADPTAGQPALAGDASPPAVAEDGAAPVTAEGAALAEPLEEKKEKTAAQKTGDRLAGKQDVVGKDFKAGGMEAGTKAFKELVDSVDFPKFVSGLIEGVFTSIVDSSIRQMQAYGKLLEGVVKSVEQFASDHISQNQARDYLGDRFPDTFSVDTGGGKPRLRLRSGLDDEEKALENVKTTLGLKEAFDVDEEEGEARLLRQAQLEMAKMRQQQLATMVLLGINRIVVTDGLINAKVVFDVKANDSANRRARASLYDTQQDASSSTTSGGGWFSDDHTSSALSDHKTVVSSSVDDTSESKAQLKANLTGEVRVNFKSETFPLDKMASQVQIGTVNERAQR
ncbi:hypothetical protein [Longimicrobium sp.]|uniref:hypothetical protein n=1 Tax=Longimicrobium sp. TaxID=2029185 RepID=UPI002CF062F8|nr:hypothetical protein [Longimicrobium sp.]HSU14307.1 hypothetical protein [Longimicrobium sp.]